MVNNKKQNKNKRGVLYLLNDDDNDIIKLRLDGTIFGRENGDIILGDNEMSATHCQIQMVSECYHIFDMNSTNGTFVNGQKILKCKLNDGDKIAMGKISFRFKLEHEKNVRNIQTVYSTSVGETNKTNARKANLIDTIIEDEVSHSKKIKISLEILYANGKKERVQVLKKDFYIGRASSFAHFDIDKEMSRKHALVKVNVTGEIFVEDQGSTNGIAINGKKVKGMHRLRAKDVLLVGTTKMMIKIQK